MSCTFVTITGNRLFCVLLLLWILHSKTSSKACMTICPPMQSKPLGSRSLKSSTLRGIQSISHPSDKLTDVKLMITAATVSCWETSNSTPVTEANPMHFASWAAVCCPWEGASAGTSQEWAVLRCYKPPFQDGSWDLVCAHWLPMLVGCDVFQQDRLLLQTNESAT